MAPPEEKDPAYESRREKDESFVAGQVYYDKREVPFATHMQSHITVGKEDPETGTVVVTTILTSSKGNKTGIAGCFNFNLFIP